MNLKGIDCRVVQTYSSPSGEGADQAEKLSALGFNVTLMHEDAISRWIDTTDFAIFGSDLILEDKFLNKTGTFPLIMMLSHFQKPVYVLAENRKVFQERSLSSETLEAVYHESGRSSRELYGGKVQAIQVFNYYFEFTLLSFVNQVFLG